MKIRIASRAFCVLVLTLSVFKTEADTRSRLIVGSRGGADIQLCRKYTKPTIVVQTGRQFLMLCRDGNATSVFEVAFGSGGVGKSKQGDRKTPRGEYSVSPINSPGYGRAVSVGYPNAKERSRGYTGGDILIHARAKNMANDMTTLKRSLIAELGAKPGEKLQADLIDRMKSDGLTSVNWTAGCLAVASAAQLQKIVSFVTSNKNVKIVID